VTPSSKPSPCDIFKPGAGFRSTVEAVIVGFSNIYKGRDESQSSYVQWSEVFHQRMLTYNNVLSPESAATYEILFREYLNLEGLEPTAKHCVESFVTYLSTHRQDPDNSLLGRTPHSRIAKQLGFLDLLSVSDLELNETGIHEEDPTSCSSSMEPRLLAAANRTTVFEKGELIEQLQHWSSVQDSDSLKVLAQMRTLMQILKAEQQWDKAWAR
jgi:hypothetical protein